ncbi:MAG: 16S rRNA (cytosine(967)-C(5))-methyltransferase RsmB [Lachnospiraceae bacterium]|nr:16S rRNA (cytosine(967)-C(5))-methyltransferase RsmB [Lachnospiraceae bacterium]
MTENLRQIALEIVVEVLEHGEYSNRLLNATLQKYQYLEKNKRSFLSRLTLGTIEHKIELDAYVDLYSNTPVRKMKPVIRNIMRISVYQMVYMDGIPVSAVCNEAVKLANAKGFRQLKGFVNGVLRNVARGLEAYGAEGLIMKTCEDKPFEEQLSLIYSMPQWIVEEWLEEFGKTQARAMLAAFLTEKATVIRTNLSKTTPEKLRATLESEGVTVEPVEELPYAFAIHGFDHLGGLKSFNDGLFYVQDISSMMVSEQLELSAGQQVLDVCAAPGGKSLHAATFVGDSGHVEARDVSYDKVSLIEENIARNQVTNVSAKVWDATVLDEDCIGKMDRVIADLPCSGLGVLSGKPEIKYRVTKEDVLSLAALQRQMLDVVCQYVKVGGRMAFSTCTINHFENEDNTMWFLENHPEFTLISREQMLPKPGLLDGFYIAVLERKEV